MEKKLHTVLTIRLFTDEKCFGPGIATLLHHIEDLHSLRSAAMQMNMAYSKAWTIVRNAEAQLGFKLLHSTTGGRHTALSQISMPVRRRKKPMGGG